MKPTDLDDLEPVEPSEALLERVQARSRAIRRRGTQRAVTVASGALVLVFAIGVALTRGEGGNNHIATRIATPSSTTTTVPTLTDAVLKGTWRPVWIADYRGPLTHPPLGWTPRLRFDGAGHFGGSDGCNDVGGTYGLGSNGAFHLAQHGSTLVACSVYTPTPASLSTAVRVGFVGGQLTFFARDGHELARYVRAPTA
jgi:heat shock protein HslJ